MMRPQNIINAYSISLLCVLMFGCSLTKSNVQNATVNGKYKCMVCSMIIPEETEAFHYNHNDQNYLFDTYECKQVFKRNSEKFIVHEN